MAYTRDIKDMTIHISKAGIIHVQFDIRWMSSIGSVIIPISIGQIEIHSVLADTLFLLFFTNMDWLGIYFNNIDNSLVMKNTLIPVIWCFNHLFMLGESSLNFFITQCFNHNSCYLTETKLNKLHRRFGHPIAMKLCLLLEQSGHKVYKSALNQLTKYCFLCKKYGKSLGCFKFTLRNDDNFNYSIFVDIIYMDNQQYYMW